MRAASMRSQANKVQYIQEAEATLSIGNNDVLSNIICKQS
jgi:hypothetical protein